MKRIFDFFFTPQQDTCPVIVKCFYIVGTSEERTAKFLELTNANPQLTFRKIYANENYSATALQLSDKSFAGDFNSIIIRAQAQQAKGENSVFELSAPVREFRP